MANIYKCKECDRKATISYQSSQKGSRTLGTWRCSVHGKTAVRRSKIEKESTDRD